VNVPTVATDDSVSGIRISAVVAVNNLFRRFRRIHNVIVALYAEANGNVQSQGIAVVIGIYEASPSHRQKTRTPGCNRSGGRANQFRAGVAPAAPFHQLTMDAEVQDSRQAAFYHW
jgi:hypothetical protein